MTCELQFYLNYWDKTKSSISIYYICKIKTKDNVSIMRSKDSTKFQLIFCMGYVFKIDLDLHIRLISYDKIVFEVDHRIRFC